jgi:hypothetical protein
VLIAAGIPAIAFLFAGTAFASLGVAIIPAEAAIR